MDRMQRRSSMTVDQAQQLAAILRRERTALQLSMRQVAALSGVPLSTVSNIEAANILAPQPHTLKALAGALQTSVSDIYATVGWLPADELPSFRPYMRAKYRDLNEAALADLERYADKLSQRVDSLGPLDHEDENLE